MARVDLRDLDTDDRLRSLDEGHCRRQRGNARTLAQRHVGDEAVRRRPRFPKYRSGFGEDQTSRLD
jgi:hypothetical protein